MMLTGKRHPFLARFEVGHDAEGRLLAVRTELFANGGWSMDLSQPICDRAMFHHDNGYYVPAMEVTGRVVKTHVASNTAFRGFGGPQGMLVMEEIIDRVARRCGLAPEVVRERNLYRGSGETNRTHYGQDIGDNRLALIWHELSASAEVAMRRAELVAWNARSPHHKRGLAMTPVKFGISFTNTMLNQAGAHVLIYADGSVQVNHGGTEMGQGLHTKVLAIASRELGLSPGRIRVMATRTDQVPNTSATAASSGTDLNGAAVRNACAELRGRLAAVAAEMLAVPPTAVVFTDDRVHAAEKSVAFAEVAQRAWTQRVSLAATGFYTTPEIGWDRAAGKGRPFYYFACGAAVSEVEVDGFTGMMQVRRVDILHDCGESLNEGVDRGQVEGGFVQGMGWLTSEELIWDEAGRLLTHSPDTYKIPSIGDVPKDFRVRLLPKAAQAGVVHGSKAVGEPPLMLAISVREAIRDAVAAFRGGGEVRLASPATGEAIWRAIRA
jgi:xanthine dehydrogenase molybdopterin binding subunit